MLRRCLLAFLLAAFASPLLAQNSAPPDLSGTWVLNLAKSRLAKQDPIASQTITITCSGTTIQFHDISDGTESTQTYVADGKERAFAEARGVEEVVRATWKKSALVIEEIGRVKSPSMPTLDGTETLHVTDRWTLSDGGHVLTDQSTGFVKQIFVYDKQ